MKFTKFAIHNKSNKYPQAKSLEESFALVDNVEN